MLTAYLLKSKFTSAPQGTVSHFSPLYMVVSLKMCFTLLSAVSLLLCLGFYAVSTVIHLFNGNSSQTPVSWTISTQYLTSPLSWLWQASRSTIPIILRAKRESHYYQLKTLVCRGRGSNPRPPAHEVDALTTKPQRRCIPVASMQQLIDTHYERCSGKGRLHGSPRCKVPNN